VGYGQLGVGHCAGAAGGVFSVVFSRPRSGPFLPGRADCVARRRAGDGDGTIATPDGPRQRISIFLNVFNVHVNRSPIGGVLSRVRYQKGQYLNAMNPASADRNEQNAVTVRARGSRSRSSRLPACWRGASSSTCAKATGGARAARGADQVWLARGCVILPAEAALKVKVGQKVKGGESVLAAMPGGAPGGCERPRPGCGQGQRQGAAAARHVPAAFAVYLRQHCAGYFSITETIKAISGDAPRTWTGRRSPSCSPFPLTRWTGALRA
jgi:hypothetical protein